LGLTIKFHTNIKSPAIPIQVTNHLVPLKVY